MTAPTNPNGNVVGLPLYDPTGHQVGILVQSGTPVQDSTTGLWYAPLQIAGSLSVTPPTDLNGTGTISAAQSGINTPVSSATVVLALGTGQSTWKALLKDGGGGFTSGTTLVADKSPDGGTTWFSSSFKVNGASPNTPASSVVGPGPLELTGNAAGATHVRIRCNVLNSTETVSIRIDASTGVAEVGIIAPLPVGSNVIGGVTIADGSDVAEGATTATAYSDATGAANGAVTGVLKGVFVKLAAIATSVAGVLAVKRSAVAVYSLASTQSTGSTQNSGDLTIGLYTEISLDINTTAQSGTNPTVQFFYERKGADGLYYVLWQSSVLSAAANTVSTSIGAGMAYNQSLGSTGRLRWVVGGTATPTYTFSANITGK